MIVAAHPDDEILGCGGTIARLTNAGTIVEIIIVGEGVTSRQSNRDIDSKSTQLKELSEQCRKACQMVGAQGVNLLGFPDNRLDSVDLLDIIKQIESIKDRVQPEIVMTHWGYDLNIDHRIVNRAVHTAFRPTPNEKCTMILEWETLSSTQWTLEDHAFSPQLFVDVTDFLETKKSALGIYSSEIRSFPHARSLEAIEALALYRGTSSGLRAAEAFLIKRLII